MERTQDYDYELNKDLIAKEAISPRDNAKLLIYNKKDKSIKHSIFKNISDYIPKDSSLIFNNTKVLKARFFAKKKTGAKLEILFNKEISKEKFLVLIKGRVKEGDILIVNDINIEILKKNEDGTRLVSFCKKNKYLNFKDLIKIFEEIGAVPLPPYIDRLSKKEDEFNYQSIFSKYYGAVAAPTASLHFTPKLYKKIKDNFNTGFITLHIGAGTFKTLNSTYIKNHKMHSEYYKISKEAQDIINSKEKILAVGTTVTRSIEYYYRLKKKEGECDLFLSPFNKPKRVDYLLTNFHLPRSTLIILVASFIGRSEVFRVYQEAMKNKYRFYSYGDAMLII